MRALVVQQPGGPEAMRLRRLPAPQPGPGQVVVAVEAVGVNPVDAGAWQPVTVPTPVAGTCLLSGRGVRAGGSVQLGAWDVDIVAEA